MPPTDSVTNLLHEPDPGEPTVPLVPCSAEMPQAAI